jgi:GntP family gluconate:H+ symporter
MFLAAIDYWPLWVLGIGVAVVIVAVAFLKIHPFFSLLLAAITVGLLSTDLPDVAGKDGIGHMVKALELPMVEMGNTAGKIAFAIALAAIIGMCLMESGAADRIVLRLVEVLGEKRAALALLLSGFLLSIPVFFDTVFFLLIPLARALAIRLKKNYVLFVMAICGGAAITHSLVAPTPGPLLMAENLQIDLGISIAGGLLGALVPAASVLLFAALINRFFPMELSVAGDDAPDSPAASVAPSEGDGERQDEEPAAVTATDSDEHLPGFFVSILPVVLPVFLIAFASFFGVAMKAMESAGSLPPAMTAVQPWVDFFGNKNFALLLGTIIAVGLVLSRKKPGLNGLAVLMDGPFQVAGVIILITSAGGAFGAMIKHTGVADTIKELALLGDINYVLLAWLVAVVLKIAQGSGTVAMITTSSMMFGIIGDGSALPYHPMYIFIAIGYGSMAISWMNDSGFWVVGRLSGFREKQTLCTWTLLLLCLSITGILQTWLMATVLPLK